MTLELYPLRFHFVAKDPIHFPAGKPGNILRGAFGHIFKRIACVPECLDTSCCELRRECSYARIFETASIEPGPSGFANWPRPFVFRAGHLDGVTIQPGQSFYFDVNIFDLHDTTIAYFVLVFAQLATEGIGPSRGRATLSSVWQLDVSGQPYIQIDNRTSTRPLGISLAPPLQPIRAIRVEFITPTELKARDEIVLQPDFPALFRRVRDRVGIMLDLYGQGAFEIDFQAMGERSTLIRMTHCDIHHVHVSRTSTRTGQTHPLGGFVGSAEYQGINLTEFVPFLEAAQWTGVGRHTVWGNGEILVHVMRE